MKTSVTESQSQSQSTKALKKPSDDDDLTESDEEVANKAAARNQTIAKSARQQLDLPLLRFLESDNPSQHLCEQVMGQVPYQMLVSPPQEFMKYRQQ